MQRLELVTHAVATEQNGRVGEHYYPVFIARPRHSAVQPAPRSLLLLANPSCLSSRRTNRSSAVQPDPTEVTALLFFSAQTSQLVLAVRNGLASFLVLSAGRTADTRFQRRLQKKHAAQRFTIHLPEIFKCRPPILLNSS